MIDVVIYRRGQPWAETKLDAFVTGLRRHGIKPEQRRAGDWRLSDIAVVWAHRDAALHKLQLEAHNHYIVLERGYLGDITERRRYTSVGFDGLNGRANFRNADSPPDRWEERFSHLMDIWGHERGKYVLLAGQVAGDSSVSGYDIRQVYQEWVDALLRLDHEVLFRPHPMSRDVWAPDGVLLHPGSSLAADLSEARCLVAINSNSAVGAVLAGVPAVVMDEGSMAWPVAGHDIKGVLLPRRPDRRQWACDLAYTQWDDDELRDGEAWEHLYGTASA